MKLPNCTFAVPGSALAGFALAVVLSACNSATPTDNGARGTSTNSGTQPRNSALPRCTDCGRINAIEEFKAKGSGTGIGAVTGAVAGAIVGHQIGDGRGQDAATVAGAIGGGVAGNEIEKRTKSTTYYRVTVSMENGGSRVLEVDTLNGFSTGSRVRVIGNNLQALSS